MIEERGGYYILSTEADSYVFRITGHGDAESIYYGRRIDARDVKTLAKKRGTLLVNTLYPDGDIAYGIDDMGFEYSFPFRGDSRSAACILRTQHDSTFDFQFKGAVIGDAVPNIGFPVPRGFDDTLKVTFKDAIHVGAELELWYLIYEKYNVIARFTRVINNSDDVIFIDKAVSAQYDIECRDRELVTFNGAWGRERQAHATPLKSGKFTDGSYSGMSSAECNPLFIVKDSTADERMGDAYGFNLIYSASHEIGAEVTPYGGLRITHGVQSEGFSYRLESGEIFATPTAISTFSHEGFNGISANMHSFICECVSPKTAVPIMLNSWEAVYFDINETNLTSFADKACLLGFEGVVIDDGWFCGRNDDTTSLGDWVEDKTKFPHGMRAFSDYLHAKDMRFGIWIEPEMISEKSSLFAKDDGWALIVNGARSIVGRGQRILDFTNANVRTYIYGCLARLVVEYGADYIKWDFNRRFSDIIGEEGSAYFYRYTLGLYDVLSRFTREFPDVIIENCASGGGRFDLGMLTFCRVGWVSDNTDALSRAEIQYGTSYGYPPRVMLNHISAAQSHQAKRFCSFKARRDTAFTGAFGAQYDVTAISDEEAQLLKNAVADYKKIREIIAEASLFRLLPDGNVSAWQLLANKRGFLYIMLKRFYTVDALPIIRLTHLDGESAYRIFGDGIDVTARGATLMNAGLVLPQIYQGVGSAADTLETSDVWTLFLTIEKGAIL